MFSGPPDPRVQPVTHQGIEDWMMEIVDVEIVPGLRPHVTPLELLEDFADVSRDWLYLEDDSRHYSSARGGRGCVLRACSGAQDEVVDYAFADVSTADTEAFRLLLICPADTYEAVEEGQRALHVDHFLRAFSGYLGENTSCVSVKRYSAPIEEALHA